MRHTVESTVGRGAIIKKKGGGGGGIKVHLNFVQFYLKQFHSHTPQKTTMP